MSVHKREETEGSELADVERWPKALGDLHARVAGRFLRPEVRQRAYRYLASLLGRVERKNSWQMAEAMGERGPQGAQRLLNAARWDADAVRDDLREYIVEHLGDEKSGVLIVDETGFLKKGKKSVGVARQYTGTAGKRENAQVGVFLAYSSEKGTTFIDRALYLPREWVGDIERREEAGIPQRVRFATKGELAKEMLRRAFEAEVPARWVVADTVYGTARGLRGWLEEQQRSYVLAVPATQGVYHGGRQRQVRALAKMLPEEAWVRLSAGTGSKGERLYDWACVSLPDPDTQEEEEEEEAAAAAAVAGRWLLVRRNIDDPAKLAYYLAYGPKVTPPEELIRVAGSRWTIEDGFEAAKGEVGLDEYEVRKWEAWHRHITLCLLAHAYLVTLRSAAKDGAAPKLRAKKGIIAAQI